MLPYSLAQVVENGQIQREAHLRMIYGWEEANAQRI